MEMKVNGRGQLEDAQNEPGGVDFRTVSPT